MAHTVTINEIKQITHDVKQFNFEKPDGYTFEPGQATEVSINKAGWKDANQPFTFTSLNTDPFLQFTIKIYNDRNGLTKQIGELKEGDQFIIHDVWGTINYKGPGVFIAGGAGITPFIAILRQLAADNELEGNKLIFSNKSVDDIILKDEFETMLGANFTNVITDIPTNSYIFQDGFIVKEFLKFQISNFRQPFYVCGPAQFNKNILSYLKDLGAHPQGLVFEE